MKSDLIKSRKTTEQKTMGCAFVALLFGIVIVGLGTMVIIYFNIPNFKDLLLISKTGPLGDTFNGILGPFLTLVLSVMTFAAFYVQYDFNKKQIDFNKRVAFESSFFELFKMHNDHVALLKITYQKHPYENYLEKPFILGEEEGEKVGKNFFSVVKVQIWQNVLERVHSREFNIETVGLTGNEEKKYLPISFVVKSYENIYEGNPNHLGYYFRSLYNLYKYTKEYWGNDVENRNRYYDLIRAYLSSDELFVLHLNFNYKYGLNFQKLIEGYDLFKHFGGDDKIEENDFELFKENPRREGDY